MLAYLVGWILMSRAPERGRDGALAGPTPQEVAAVAPEAARVRAQMAEWGRGFDDGLDAILGVWSLRLPPGSPGRLAGRPRRSRGRRLPGSSRSRAGGGGKKRKGKKGKGKKAKKGVGTCRAGPTWRRLPPRSPATPSRREP